MTKNIKENWKEGLMDEFCVMFERASQADDTIDWVVKLEAFISQAIADERKRLAEDLQDCIRKVESEIDLLDDEYQDKNPVIRDSVWGYHNRIRLIMLKLNQVATLLEEFNQ